MAAVGGQVGIQPEVAAPEGGPPPAAPGPGAPAAAPRHARRRTPRASSVALVALVVAQVGTIVVFGALTAARYPLWSPVDEAAHYDSVLWIAEHGSLPVLGQTPASEQSLAIGQGVYPRHTTIDAAKAGLTGLSYEAFQPPLYYMVASPVFHLSGDYRTKAYLLRFFGLALLLAAVALLARLSRHVLKDRWLVGLSVGLLVLMMPGVVTRAVTISNVNLAVPLVIACVTELWLAWERRSGPRLVAAGALVGLGVLTDLYLVELVPVFVAVAVSVVWRRRTWSAGRWAAAGGAVALVAVVPWAVFNEVHFHSLTASALAKREQLAVVNPGHIRDTVGQVPGLTLDDLFAPLMPQEWVKYLCGPPPAQPAGHRLRGAAHPRRAGARRGPGPAPAHDRLLDPARALARQPGAVLVHRRRPAVGDRVHGEPLHLPDPAGAGPVPGRGDAQRAALAPAGAGLVGCLLGLLGVPVDLVGPDHRRHVRGPRPTAVRRRAR